MVQHHSSKEKPGRRGRFEKNIHLDTSLSSQEFASGAVGLTHAQVGRSPSMKDFAGQRDWFEKNMSTGKGGSTKENTDRRGGFELNIPTGGSTSSSRRDWFERNYTAVKNPSSKEIPSRRDWSEQNIPTGGSPSLKERPTVRGRCARRKRTRPVSSMENADKKGWFVWRRLSSTPVPQAARSRSILFVVCALMRKRTSRSHRVVTFVSVGRASQNYPLYSRANAPYVKGMGAHCVYIIERVSLY